MEEKTKKKTYGVYAANAMKGRKMNYMIYVTPNEYKGKDTVPGATPWEAKLHEGNEYVVIKIFDEDIKDPNSEAYMVVVNNEGEVWFISNRHLRVTRILTPEGNTMADYTYRQPEKMTMRGIVDRGIL